MRTTQADQQRAPTARTHSLSIVPISRARNGNPHSNPHQPTKQESIHSPAMDGGPGGKAQTLHNQLPVPGQAGLCLDQCETSEMRGLGTDSLGQAAMP